jgi:hypothetical protein
MERRANYVLRRYWLSRTVAFVRVRTSKQTVMRAGRDSLVVGNIATDEGRAQSETGVFDTVML